MQPEIPAEASLLWRGSIARYATLENKSTHFTRANPANGMSYLTRRIKGRLRNIARQFRDHGFRGVAGRIVHHFRWLREFRQRDSAFDKKLGVDTRGPVGLWHLRVRSNNLQHAIRYEGVNPGVFRRALSEIGESFTGFSFIDLGCGKGRALLLANEFNFSQIIGIEFAAKLAAVARKNCQRAGVSATVLSQDAAQFSFPPVDSVVYLYNPFGPTVMDPVLDRLLAATNAKCYLVYVNPIHRRQCFDTRPRLRCVSASPEYAIWAVTSATLTVP
jgi:predicted RNA methylase